MKTGGRNILSRLKWIATATLLFTLTQNIYSQSIDSLPWKEINKYLKEGIECKELVKQKNHEIDSLAAEGANRDTLEKLLRLVIEKQDRKQIQDSAVIHVLDSINKTMYHRNFIQKAKTEAAEKKTGFWRNTLIFTVGFFTTLLFIIK